jgi:hypothetical protein
VICLSATIAIIFPLVNSFVPIASFLAIFYLNSILSKGTFLFWYQGDIIILAQHRAHRPCNKIDTLSENADNADTKEYEATFDGEETLKKQAEAQEQRCIAENAKKARKLAEQEFPGEKWQKIEDRIYISPNRPIGKKTSYQDEKRDAEILRSFGSTIYLTPETRSTPERKYDAIVNDQKMEFKNVGGNANTLITHFLKSRSQAPNVFLNLETSDLTRREVMDALYGARNSRTHTNKNGTVIKGYADSNKFAGGRIILKLKGRDNLIYLNVDNLKSGKQ